MNPELILLFGAAGTYLLRVLFITIVPAELLPDRVREVLPMVGPAALASLIAADLAHSAGSADSRWPALTVMVAGGAICALTRNLALTIIGGTAAAVLVGLLT